MSINVQNKHCYITADMHQPGRSNQRPPTHNQLSLHTFNFSNSFSWGEKKHLEIQIYD